MGRVAIVTGGNQGLGLALVQTLARDLGDDDVVYLATRSEERGLAAKETLSGCVAEVRVKRHRDVADEQPTRLRHQNASRLAHE